MKTIIVYILLLIPFLTTSCQERYSQPPYDDEEVRLRKANVNDTTLVISTDWQERDSLSYLRFKNAKSITLFQTDDMPIWVSKFKQLKEIGTQGCDSIQIPDDLKSLSKLTHLFLYKSKISEVPHFIEDFSDLVNLGLTGNTRNKLSFDLAKLKQLEVLYLSDFTEIPDNIYELNNLKELWLINCNIDYVSPKIKQLRYLESLNLWANTLTTLPKELLELPNLREIFYDEDKITDEEFKKQLKEHTLKNMREYIRKREEKKTQEYEAKRKQERNR